MQSFVEAVRKAALPAIWSQGVKLARERSVSRVATNGAELVLRVRAPGQAVAPTVTLYTHDDEWSCDCDAKTDPCAHVAAAAIAVSQGEDALAPAAAAAPSSRLVYKLTVRDRRLSLARVIVTGDREAPVTGSLASDIARGKALPIEPTHEDVLVDRILSSSSRDTLPLGRIGDILGALASAEVLFDGARITLSGEPLKPSATLDDAPNGGFTLKVDRAPGVEAIAMGVGRKDGVLRPLAETQTTGEWLEKLPLARTFAAKEQAELVGTVLPTLEKTIDVDVRTARLGRTTKKTRPRIAFDLGHHGHALSVMATIVYGDPPIARVDGDVLVALGKEIPARHPAEEKELVLRLRDELDLLPGRRLHFDGDDAIRFAARLRRFQSGAIAELEGGTPLVPRITVGDDGSFDVAFEELTDDGTVLRADPAAVLRAWKDGMDRVPAIGLDGETGWAPLPAAWLAQHGDRVADLLAARDAEKKLPTSALPDLGALCAALDRPAPLGLARLAPLADANGTIPEASLPPDLRAELRSYQRRGVDWLSFLRDAGLGAVLADDMGLGKTLQIIATLKGRGAAERGRRDRGGALVVCPKSVVYNWEAEIARFRPSLKTAIYHGAGRAFDDAADVTLTTYAVLRLDSEKLAAREWDVVVLDEAQAIKNPTSQTARAAFTLRAPFRAALSGTPVENRLDELWSVMHFANPGLLGGRSDFDTRYTTPIANADARAAERLRAKIRPFVLRRLKKDVLPELPPRTDQTLPVELEDGERVVYDAVRAATKKELSEKLGGGGNVLAALEALLRLRQAACHAALVPGQQAQSSSKVERLLEALEDAAADGHKALVFSQWTSLLDLVEPHLQHAGIAFTRLDGSTKDRAAVVNEFSADGGPPVMLISLKAGGTGLNLVAADHVFLLDPWWNPAVEDQAADRAHRIGQDRPVMVYRLVAKNTVEERILALQEKKRAVADVALGDATGGAAITREELLALLED